MMISLKAVVEALLFSAPRPLSTKEVLQVLKAGAEYLEEENPLPELDQIQEPEIRAILAGLAQEYTELGRAFQLVEQVAGWQLTSRPEYQVWVRQLFPELRPTRLSAPALETLAIIAYRQPITRADIEAIRGVAVDGLVQKLLDAGLVKISGRADIPGRPLLYETTQHFMEHFGLKTLEELPNATELRQLPLPVFKPEEAAGPAAAETGALVAREAAAAPETEANLNEETTSGRTEAVEDPSRD
ncbi:MAG: SMC-Scp complex subunit ScpB [Verrucomicrobia bacterium]|nr:SMC-Scp complex subunit ScpB [Verrucomicrobiota bacterium]